MMDEVLVHPLSLPSMDTRDLLVHVPEIFTGRLFLRKLSDADALSLLKIYSDVGVTRFCDLKTHQSLDDSIAFITSANHETLSGKGLTLGIVFEGSLIGTCRFYHFNPNHRFVSIGFELNKNYWRKGFMYEALKAAISHLFGQAGINRIEAQVFTGNTPSVYLLKKLGFKKEGLMRENFLIEGKLENSYLYSLIKNDLR